jgi:protein TonB
MKKGNASITEYGRFELNGVFQKNYVLGLLISVMIHGLAISSWHAAQNFREEEGIISSAKVRILKYSDLGPPPSITAKPSLPAVGVAPIAKPEFGTPVPVPDLQVGSDQTIATLEELANVSSLEGENLGEGEIAFHAEEGLTSAVENDADEPGIDEVVPVDKSPEMVVIELPRYPEMAIRAGLEGTVWVKLLVGKDGKVLKAVIVKSTAEIFNDVTAEAAMKFVFTPAYTHAGPLKAWIEIPFKFRLKDASLAARR